MSEEIEIGKNRFRKKQILVWWWVVALQETLNRANSHHQTEGQGKNTVGMYLEGLVAEGCDLQLL